MNVTILDDTPDLGRVLLRRCWVAAKTCTSSKTPAELWARSGKLSDEKLLRVVEDEVIASGHLSVLRHAAITYGIDGVSRACAQQLTRHVAGISYEMQSQRAVTMNPGAVVVPPSVSESEEANPSFLQSVGESNIDYQWLLKYGIPKEDARYLTPIGAKTNLVMTANLNALINLCQQRLCIRAQWEIRRLAAQIRAVTGRQVPWFKKHLTISCISRGFCVEASNKGNAVCAIRPHQDSIQIVPRVAPNPASD